jgi:dihydrofolate synthase/folylpolyglutamate synthase
MDIAYKYQEILNYLYSFIDLSVSRNLRYSVERFNLSRMNKFMSLLGNPHLQYDVIHVAGTKGKGSVCAMISSILAKAGYKVGFYSSPHMIDFCERIKVNNKNISRSDLVKVVSEMRSKIKKVEKLSTFEIITATAFQYFSNHRIKVGVIEVGMGGRLDATNIVNPLISIITPISYDHMKVLGKTIKKIAQEKAGIIKRSIPVILSPQSYTAKKTINQIALEKDSQVIDITKMYSFKQLEYSLQKQTFEIIPKTRRTHNNRELVYEIPLIGDHQIKNAITAFACIEYLKQVGYEINDKAIKSGFSNVRWPGRFEIIHNNPCLIIDGAHNRDSFKKLVKIITKYLSGKEIVLIFGVSEDKEVNQMLKIVKPYIKHIILTKSEHPRALGFDALKKIADEIMAGKYSLMAIEDIIPFIFSKNTPNTVYIASGSIFIAGAIKQLLQEEIK